MIPIIVHQGFKIIGDMTKLVFYLFFKVVPTSDRETMHRMSRSSSVPAPFIESYIRSAKNTAGLLARATAI